MSALKSRWTNREPERATGHRFGRFDFMTALARRAMPRIAILSMLGCLGCGSDDGGATPPAKASIGSGDNTFSALSDGSDALIVLGPQGGYHLVGAVQVSGLKPGDPSDLGSPDNPTTTFVVENNGIRIDAGGAHYTQGLDPVGANTFEMIGRIVILDITNADAINGSTLGFSVTVTDIDGISATDSVQLIARPDPRNP